MTKILIVDDDEQLRAIAVRTLTTCGFDCHAVGTLKDALAAISSDAPDVVLLDVAIGTESGLDIHRALRERHARLPAVIFTTSKRDVFDTMLEQLGPLDDWIIRPWDRAEFIARVVLASRRAVADQAATTSNVAGSSAA